MKVISKSDSVRHDRVRLVHRTMTEREVLAIADHPFIVKLYYAFQTKRFFPILAQHCEGGHLHQTIRIQTHGFLPEHVARFYAAEVLVVLEYLHMMGVLYDVDLKPKNILLRANGHIVLCDFDSSSMVNPMERGATASPPGRRRRRRPWDCLARCLNGCWNNHNHVSPLDTIMPISFHSSPSSAPQRK
ncbi:hypothetical protein DYB25_003954, partial [Aphanomyces astaci]